MQHSIHIVMSTLSFQVEFMVLINIEQSRAAWLMTLLGVLELIARVLMSVFGDYIKGRVLYACIVCSVGMAVLHAVAAQANTFVHMLIYVISKSGICLFTIINHRIQTLFRLSSVFGIFCGPIVSAAVGANSEVLLGKHLDYVYTLFKTAAGVGCFVGPIVAGTVHS